MAKNKLPRKKKYTAKRNIQLAHNLDYWIPIKQTIIKENGSLILAEVNQEIISDDLFSVIMNPVKKAIEHFNLGSATFKDYWVCIQILYLYAHLLSDAVGNQKYRIYKYHQIHGDKLNDLAVQHFLEPYINQLKVAQDDYPNLIKNIGERHKRTGKYGMSGDERTMILTITDNITEMLDWCSVAMVTRAMKECLSRLTEVETRIFKKHSNKE